MVLVLLPDDVHAVRHGRAGLMGTFVPTPEQREIMDRIQRDLTEWVGRQIIGRDEMVETLVALLTRRCEEMNAAPLFTRFQMLADMHGADYSGVIESVQDVTWSVREREDGDCVIDTNVLLKRSVEQVYVTFSVTPKEPIIDEHVMRCPAQDCDWHWDLRSGVDRERDIREGTVCYLSHHRNDHPLDLDDLDGIEKVKDFKINRFYSDGGSVRIQDLEAQMKLLTDKVNELVEVANTHTKELR